MKYFLPLAATLVVAVSIPFCACAQENDGTPTPAPTPVSDLSQFKTPADLAHYIEGIDSLPAKTAAEFDKNTADIRLATADFLKRFPTDPLAWEAKLIDARLVFDATGRGKAGDMAKAEAALKEIAAAPAADAKFKYDANVILARIPIRSVADDKLEPWLVAWHKDHQQGWHDETLGMLIADRLVKWDQATKEKYLLVLKNSEDFDIYGSGEDLLWAAYREKRDASFKAGPLDLKFTAVDGTPIDVSKLRGKVVLIDFWAVWCHSCMEEMPEVIAAYNKYHAQGLEVIGISLDEDKDKDRMLTTMKAKGMVWPQYFDGKKMDNLISYAYGINSIPVVWLLNKKGMVVSTATPDGHLNERIEKLLAE